MAVLSLIHILRKAKRQAKQLAVFAGEVVRLMDKEGHSLQG